MRWRYWLFYSNFISLVILFLAGCSFRPQIIRQVIPDVGKQERSGNIAIIETNGIVISLRYINKDEFWKISREYDNEFLANIDAPLFTVFKMKIENSSSRKIRFGEQNSYIRYDNVQYQEYKEEEFLEKYPECQNVNCRFLFDFKYIDIMSYLSSSLYPFSKVVRVIDIDPLFQLEGFLVFDRIPENIKNFEVNIFAKKFGDSEISLKFLFKQRIIRLGGM